MSYLRLPEKSELQPEVLRVVEESEKRWGYSPNIVRAYALAPNVLFAEDVWAKGVMHEGFLPRKIKEAIATVVSRTNDCLYCATSHAYAVGLAGGNEQDQFACIDLDFSLFDEKESSALRFARKATVSAKSITQNDINELQKHFSDPEIVEIATVIQQFMGYNWFVTILGLQLEDENPLKNKISF